MAEVPFSQEQWPRWREDPAAFLESQFPGLSLLVTQRGERLEELSTLWGHTYWSVDKAKAVLGYQPQYNFPEFYAALKAGNEAHYPFANLPWWGAD